ncbi:MAG: methionyl-tRNA formyltransferase [Gammaproteobacteria bacterium]|nr:methionyl-tRNA formyltransferase [Gammaproteobacteria bacterium]
MSASAPLRIIFAGTPEFSVAPLQALLNSAHDVVAVYTQPDRPAGRGRKLTASPVKAAALAHDLPVYQPENFKEVSDQQQLAALNADVMVVVAYGLILPKVILEMPKLGCLNIHASLLPRWRGAAPIQRAIESGDALSGVTIMQMDIGLDTGDMLTKVETPISQEDTAQALHDRLSTLGSEALMQTLEAIQAGNLQPEKQSESLVTYAHKLSKAEAEIQWQESAEMIVRKIQAFNPYPIAFTHFNEKPLRIGRARALTPEEAQTLRDSNTLMEKQPGLVLSLTKQGMIIGTGSDPILLLEAQPSGKKMMSAYDFAQSRQLAGYQF